MTHVLKYFVALMCLIKTLSCSIYFNGLCMNLFFRWYFLRILAITVTIFMEINTQQSLAYTIVLPDLILGFLSCVSNYEYHVTTTQHSGPKQIDHRTSINRRACQMDTRFYRRGLA